mgnify:CR=1 FL=1
MKVASNVVRLVNPDEPAGQAEIDRIFAAQRETALRLRQSTAAQRLDKIDRLKRAVLARQADIQRAGALEQTAGEHGHGHRRVPSSGY